MLEIISLLCLGIALILLIALSIIDLRHFLLPNKYVAPFALLGIIFHIVTDFYYLDFTHMILGGLVGFITLYAIRAFGNRYYGQDSLGLGDVKLLGAAGLWLGYENVLIAMTVGAFAGLMHGLLYAIIIKVRTGKFTLRRLIIPAGPGFAVGIILVAGWMYQGHIVRTLFDLLP